MNALKLSASGLAFLQAREACWLRAYRDTGGVWTIGWGHARNVREGDECTRQQAVRWLASDVANAESCVNAAVIVPLSQNRFDALVSFVFNVGCEAFRTSTLLAKLNAGRPEAAAAQFERWNHDNGVVVAGLTARRTVERMLFLAPDSPA